MKSVVTLIMAVACACIAQAQPFSYLDGVWIHAQFVKELKFTGSIKTAMEVVKSGEPLWAKFDGADSTRVVLSYEYSDPSIWQLTQQDVMGNAYAWVIGKGARDSFVVAVDTAGGTYIALHPRNSPEAIPTVLGKLPSKNQDPFFIIERMINAALLVGEWSDPEGSLYSFGPNMYGSWAGKETRCRIVVDEKTLETTVIVEDRQGKKQPFVVNRVGDKLTFTAAKKRPLVLTRVP